MTRSIEAAALAPGASLSHTLGLRHERMLLPTTRSAAGLRRPSVTKPLWTAHRADPMVLRQGIPASRRDPSAGGITAVSAQLRPRPHSAAAGETNKWIRHRFRSSGHHPRIRLPRGDPLLYSQFWLQKQWLAVTWQNPDFRLELASAPGVPVEPSTLSPNTKYRVFVRIWNGSVDGPAADVEVHLSYLDVGIG
jgi:hypothetical protein